ncbi:MAG: hypothetical protein AAF203_05325, partial [Pseudomonadota bacterium]
FTQQEFVATNPIYTKIIKSLMCGFDFDEILERYQLSQRELGDHLAALEENGYLTRQGEKDIRLKVHWPLRYEPVSMATVDRYKKWTQASIDQILTDLEDENGTLHRYEYFMSEDTAKDLRQEMRDLIERYKKRSESDVQSLPKSDLQFYSAITALGNFSGWDLLK